MSVLAVIPAKASSSRVPGKNMRPLGGVPLFLWTVKAARAVQPHMTVVVSTDAGPAGDEIAGLAIKEGTVVIRRPKELCEDPAQAPDVALHALSYLEKNCKQTFDTVVMLLPTSPFRTATHIKDALELHSMHRANVVSVDRVDAMHHKAVNLYRDNLILYGPPLRDASMSPRYAAINGAIWIAPPANLRRDRHVKAVGGHAYVMDETSGLDIDTELDWMVAEAILAQRAAA